MIARGALACLVAVLAVSPAQARADETVTYEIRKGDTWSGLVPGFVSRRAAQRVVVANRIGNPGRIRAGQRLRIPRALLRDVQTAATVDSFSGEVSLQGQAAPRLGQALGESAAIATGRNAFVTLRLADGSTITLPSQSRVRIVRLRQVVLTGAVERDFALETGRARVKVTPMPDRGSTFRVRTPVNHAAVRGTVFRVSYDDATGRAGTEVDEGKVAVSTEGLRGEVLVEPGFGIATAARFNSGAVALLPAPRLADAGKTQSGRQLAFEVDPIPGAAAYRIALGRDAGLLAPLEEASAPTPAFLLPSLPAGSYFARVAAVDAQGLEGTPRTYAFERRRNLISAAMWAAGDGQYLFRWQSEADGTPQFRFQLRRLTDAAPMVDELALAETSITVGRLPPGEYSWRVLSTVLAEGRALESWTPEQRFEVAPRR